MGKTGKRCLEERLLPGRGKPDSSTHRSWACPNGIGFRLSYSFLILTTTTAQTLCLVLLEDECDAAEQKFTFDAPGGKISQGLAVVKVAPFQ